MDRTVFIVGFAIMAIASLLIYLRGSKSVETRHHTYFHSAVPFIAATSYLAMWYAIGDRLNSAGATIATARYVDWSITTPILLSGLILLGLHEHGRASAFLVSAIVLDVLMIVAGLIFALLGSDGGKLVWFLWSCAAFVGVLYILWGPVRTISQAKGGPMAAAYGKNLGFLSLVWLLYPFVVGAGPDGLRALDSETAAWAILALDVVAKVVYAFFASRNLEEAERAKAREEGVRA